MDALDFFNPERKGGTMFSVLRNGNKLGSYLGKKVIQQGKTFINFLDVPNVVFGDTIFEEKTQVRYKVIDIQSERDSAKYFLPNPYRFFHVFVEILSETQPSNYNINANNGSVVTINSTVTAPITISHLQNQIDNCNPIDKETALELIEVLKGIEQSQQPIKKGILQKFGDFFAKYTPIALNVGQFLIQLLTMQH